MKSMNTSRRSDGRGILFFGILAMLLFITACSDPEQKMTEIEQTRYVEYFGKPYRVSRIDRKSQAVFIVEPDGVSVPVPLDNVKPIQNP